MDCLPSGWSEPPVVRHNGTEIVPNKWSLVGLDVRTCTDPSKHRTIASPTVPASSTTGAFFNDVRYCIEHLITGLPLFGGAYCTVPVSTPIPACKPTDQPNKVSLNRTDTQGYSVYSTFPETRRTIRHTTTDRSSIHRTLWVRVRGSCASGHWHIQRVHTYYAAPILIEWQRSRFFCCHCTGSNYFGSYHVVCFFVNEGRVRVRVLYILNWTRKEQHRDILFETPAPCHAMPCHTLPCPAISSFSCSLSLPLCKMCTIPQFHATRRDATRRTPEHYSWVILPLPNNGLLLMLIQLLL